jgi:hypothetical protein
MNIFSLWKTRRNWQKLFGLEKANHFCNNEIREAIETYRAFIECTVTF